MQKWFIVNAAALVTILVMAWPAPAAPILHIDPAAQNTLIFRDYNGASDQNVGYSPAPAPSQVVSGGLSTWTYSAVVSDPKIIYNDGNGTYDHASFPWVRLRYQQSRSNGGALQVWENPARGGEGLPFIASTTLREGHGDIPNPNPNGSGYRVDPFSATQNGDSLTLDYTMMDRYESIGYGEWDAEGDLNGWTSNGSISNPTVAGSLLSGTGNGDAQLNNTTAFDADLYKYVEIRMRTDSAAVNSIQLFWGAGGSFTGTRSITFNVGDQQFHTYLIDFTGEATWAGSNMRIRLDPSFETGVDFDVDSIRLRADAAIPEPSTVLLILAGLLIVSRLGLRSHLV